MIFNGVFYFDFYYEDESSDEDMVSHLFGFNFKSESVIDISSGWFDAAFNELECEYGIHDWSSSPSEKISSLGYTSYEVAPDVQVELMKKWQQVFVKNLGGENVTPVVFLGEINSDDDLAVFNRVNDSFPS